MWTTVDGAGGGGFGYQQEVHKRDCFAVLKSVSESDIPPSVHGRLWSRGGGGVFQKDDVGQRGGGVCVSKKSVYARKSLIDDPC